MVLIHQCLFGLMTYGVMMMNKKSVEKLNKFYGKKWEQFYYLCRAIDLFEYKNVTSMWLNLLMYAECQYKTSEVVRKLSEEDMETLFGCGGKIFVAIGKNTMEVQYKDKPIIRYTGKPRFFDEGIYEYARVYGLNHPKLGEGDVRTSMILSKDKNGTTFETMNSIYKKV